jgi:ATP-dependent Clp protease ATP-binding subunit ClpB
LTEAVRRKPYSVVLLDEVEKAHPDVFNLFLQMLDDNRLTDSQGRLVSFANTIIILTSNLDKEKLKEFFRPEFLNRIDEIVTFNSLTAANIKQIALKEVEKLKKILLETHHIHLMVEDLLIDDLVHTSCSKVEYMSYGARPIKRLIYTHIEVPVAKQILEKNKSGCTIFLRLETRK